MNNCWYSISGALSISTHTQHVTSHYKDRNTRFRVSGGSVNRNKSSYACVRTYDLEYLSMQVFPQHLVFSVFRAMMLSIQSYSLKLEYVHLRCFGFCAPSEQVSIVGGRPGWEWEPRSLALPILSRRMWYLWHANEKNISLVSLFIIKTFEIDQNNKNIRYLHCSRVVTDEWEGRESEISLSYSEVILVSDLYGWATTTNFVRW